MRARRLVGYTQGGPGEWTRANLQEIFDEVDIDGSGRISMKELSRALKVERTAEFRSVRTTMPPEPELPPSLLGRKRELLRLADQYERQMKGQDMCPASFAHALRLYWPKDAPTTINVSTTQSTTTPRETSGPSPGHLPITAWLP